MGALLEKNADECREEIKRLAGLGLSHTEIALLLDLNERTLRKHYQRELDLGPVVAKRQVLETLLTMATAGNNTTATLFWAKARCGMREKADAKSKFFDKPPVARIVFAEEPSPLQDPNNRGRRT
jgi:hypothetical protein